MKSRKNLLLVVILAIVVIGSALVWRAAANPGENEKVEGAPATVSKAVPGQIIILEGGVFSPAALRVKVGTPVTWTSDDDDLNHKLVSGPHPSHSLSPDLESSILGAGQSYTYTYTKVGTFPYHDEITPELGGTVIVTE